MAISVTHSRVTGKAANPNALVDGPAWDAQHVAYYTASGGTQRTLDAKLGDVVSVKDFGAVCDGVTDDSAAINAALAVPNARVVIPAGAACRVASTITINPVIGTTLCGADFDAGAYPSPTSARVIGDLTVSPVVQFIGAANGSTTIENLVVGRAAGTPGSSTVGLHIQDGYNVVLRNVLSYNHGINYNIKGQVYNASAGICLNGDKIYSYGAVDAHFVMDSFAEVRLNHCRFGRSAASGDYTCNTHFRVKGGTSGTSGGPNSLYVYNSQFNQAAFKVKHLIEFVQIGSGGVGAIDAREFVFDGCHVEGLATDANGGGGIYSDSSWNLLDRFEFTNSLFMNTSTQFFALDPATTLTNVKIADSSIYASTFSVAPNGQIAGLHIDGNWLQTATTIAAGASGGQYGSILNNEFYGNYTVTGAWTRFTSVNNDMISGSYSVTPTGSLLILDNGQAAKNSSSLASTGNITARSATAIPAGGALGQGFQMSSTANFGIFFGSGAPTLSAAQGSLYIRSDGSSTSTRLYVNTNGSTTWTNVTTAA